MRSQTAEFYKSKNGWRWRIRAVNGKVLADSGQGYSRKADALHGYILVTTGLTIRK